MTEQDLITSLISALSITKTTSPFSSLRIWYENGNMKFFLTNAEPRNTRKPSPPNQPDNASSPDEPKNNHELGQASTRQSKGRPRKRRYQSSAVESLEVQRSTRLQTEYPSISIIDAPQSTESREESVITIPCQNQYNILANLSDDNVCENSDNDEDDGQVGDLNRFCHGCEIVRVPNPWNHWCSECWQKCG